MRDRVQFFRVGAKLFDWYRDQLHNARDRDDVTLIERLEHRQNVIREAYGEVLVLFLRSIIGKDIDIPTE